MVAKLKKLSILALFMVLIFSLFSCRDDESKAIMTLLNGEEKDGAYTIAVQSGAESLNLNDYITVGEESKWTVYSDSEMKNEIDAVVSLETGVNTFYVKVKEGTTKREYTIQITRKRTVTVSFDTNGGTACHSIVADEGTVISAPVTTRAGYDFVGWNVDFSVPVASDVSAVAQWRAKEFKLIVDGVEKNVTFGEDYSLIPVDKLGYKFLKWVDTNGKDFPQAGKWDRTQNETVMAVYSPEVYKATFVYNADIANKTVNYTIEDQIVFDIPVHPEGLEFEGWYSDSQLTEKVSQVSKGTTGAKTFYAKWKVVVEPEDPEYTITIDADGYDELDGQTITVKYGGSYVLPEAPVKEGYEFVAWVNGTTIIPTGGVWTIRDNVTITIKWNAISYDIDYVIDGKTTNPNTTLTFTIEDTLAFLEPTRPNATFVGWYTSADFEESTKITGIEAGTAKDITVYAKFDITTHTLTYNPNGGTVAKDTVQYELGDEIVLLVPEYPGYKFNGWYNGDDKFESDEWTFEQDIILVAKWTREFYLVEYDKAGGTTTQTLKESYCVEDTFTLPELTRDGYNFLGWSEGDSNKTYKTVTVQKGTTGNKKFVARWSEFSFSFNGENATVTEYKFVTSRAKVKIPTTINYNGVDYTVTEIGPNVFEGLGPIIKAGKLVVNGNVVRKFDVDIPKTLKKIGKNAFYNCNEVSINVILDSGVSLSDWADSLDVAEGNDHVVDVIKGRRPAIGWSVYG